MLNNSIAMATTLKKSISPDSPQCEGQCVCYKISIFIKISKIYSIHNGLLQNHFLGSPALLTLGVTVPNTINTRKFRPSVISGSKFKIPSQYFAVNFGFANSCQLLFILHTFFACTAVPTVSF